MKPLWDRLLVDLGLCRPREDKYTKIRTPSGRKASPSNVETHIAQGGPRDRHLESNVKIPVDQVGVKTEISQEIELRDQLV
ncbi:MAG: hypothetical protein LQ343_006084 [Gyalolechia ehrenbergii]|nr:MAG: hypothetical protein LQ343_006084 [Gyalolechia ehrenbergii]